MIRRSVGRILNANSQFNYKINSIEGNIACGKSTVLEYLESKNDKNIHCIQEPVSEWTKMKSGADLLRLFYEESEKWTFSFEHLVQLSRLRSLYEAEQFLDINQRLYQDGKHMNVFIERSILSSFNVFTKNSLEEKRLNQVEFDILKKYYNLFTQTSSNADKHEFQIIYIRTSPETCYDRLRDRNRGSENQIDLNYLIRIHLKYENWINRELSDGNTIVNIIDGNCDRKHVIDQIDKVLV